MPTSSTRKISVAALGLMLAALGVDRFILGGGASGPQAASASPPEQTGPAAGAAASQAPISSLPGATIASRLDELRADLPVGKAPKDIFHGGCDWLLPPPDAPAPEAVQPVVDASSDFASRHRVTSVMLGGSSAMVVIDGVCVRQGEQFGGMRLAKVEQGAAVFELGGKAVRLTVDAVFNQAAPGVSK